MKYSSMRFPITALAGALLACATAGRAAPYQVTDLGTLGGSNFSTAGAVNNSGAITGASNGDAFLWQSGSMADLGKMPGSSQTNPTSINGNGDIAGLAMVSGNWHGFIYSGGSYTDIGTLGGSTTWASGVNNAGQVVGYSVLVSTFHAFVWQSGLGMTDLGTLGGSNSEAHAINNTGQIAGLAWDPSGHIHGAIWSGGSIQDLGIPAGYQHSDAIAINDNGVVGGRLNSATTFQWIPAIYNGGAWTVQAMTAIGLSSQVDSININGIATGYEYDSDNQTRAVIFQGGQATDLNTLIPSGTGWQLNEAMSINDSGWITGYGRIGSQTHAFLLTPSDTTAPTTTATYTGTAGANGWYTSAVSASLSATDPDDAVAATYYSLDGGALTTYTTSPSVTGDGTHTFAYHSVDSAGNTEATLTDNVDIDTTAPAISVANIAIGASSVTVAFAAADATSGVAGITYTIDGGAPQTYAGPVTVSGPGAHTLDAFSTDNAGLASTTISLPFTFASAVPSIASLSKTTAVAGSGSFALTVNGAGFNATSVVNFGADILTPTAWTPTTLTVTVPNADILAAGPTLVTVTNPPPGGGTSNSKTFTVTAATLKSVTLSPTAVTGGLTSTATVTLTGIATGAGAVVTISSANTALATVPTTTVTIPAGSSTATFTVSTFPVAVSTGVAIKAVYGGVTKSATLTVKPPTLSTISATPSPSVGGGTVNVTVTLNGNAPAGGTTVPLSYPMNSALLVSPPASVLVPAGSNSAVVMLTTMPVAANKTIKVTATLGMSKTASFTITP